MHDPNPSFTGPASAGYDAADKWSPVPDWSTAAIDRDGWTARPRPGLFRLHLAGQIDLAIAELAPRAPMSGLWEIAAHDPAVLCIGRDRALIVSEKPLPAIHGWNVKGWAATPADDAWLAFDIEGPDLRTLMARAVTVDLETGSPSAMLNFAGVPALLVRTAPATARITVEAGLAAYVWRWLEGA